MGKTKQTKKSSVKPKSKPIKKAAKSNQIKKSKKMVQANRKVPLTFITGNAKKLEEFKSIMTGALAESYEVTNMGLDLEELQGTPLEIATHKVKLAATKTNTPVLVEDVSLCFNAYNGLPGPYM